MTRDELIEELKNQEIVDLWELLDEAGKLNDLLDYGYAPMPALLPMCDEKEEVYSVVVFAVPEEARLSVMKIVKAASGLNYKKVKSLIDNPPFSPFGNLTFFYDLVVFGGTSDKPPEQKAYEDLKSLGVRVEVININQEIEEWIKSLSPDMKDDVIHNLDFFIKLFSSEAGQGF